MNEPMSPELEAAMAQLRREYVAESPARLQELRKDIAAFRAGEGDAAKSLIVRFHRLAGSGGSYGFPDISEVGRDMERWLKTGPIPGAESAARLDEALSRLAGNFDRAGAELGGAASPIPPTDFGWSGLIIGSPGPLTSQLGDILRSAGYVVTLRAETENSDLPISETPDLVIIAGGQVQSDPYAIAAALSGRRALRPRSIVLVDPTGSSDRIRAVAAGIDTVFSSDRVTRELPTYAKTLARIGTPPSSVLLVTETHESGEGIARTLEQANILVSHSVDPMEAREILSRDLPDLLLLDTTLLGVDGFTLARLVRQDPRFALLPIVFLANERTLQDQIEALRAGADHFLTKPVDPTLLLQLVINRAERGRRIREMVHRDGLTGLLNHATLMAELEHAVEYARRHQEPFSFLMIDVDHFKRINDTHGHLAGDQVLLHLARIFQSAVRASDIIGRYGGEEIGMILRRCNSEGAVILAGKLRDALIGRPATTREGKEIPVRVSIGISSCPADGQSASAIVAAADKALYRAKSSGRDRVEVFS
ncbi:MAG: diguanylate cyclase [Gemmatimonadota bacterium]